MKKKSRGNSNGLLRFLRNAEKFPDRRREASITAPTTLISAYLRGDAITYVYVRQSVRSRCVPDRETLSNTRKIRIFVLRVSAHKLLRTINTVMLSVHSHVIKITTAICVVIKIRRHAI